MYGQLHDAEESTDVGLDIPAEHKFLSVVGMAVATAVELLGDSSLAYAVQLAIHEVCANAIDHAYATPDPANRLAVRLRLDETKTAVDASITYAGRPLDVGLLSETLGFTWEPAPANGQAAYVLRHVREPELDQERGRGMFLIWQLVDEVIYMPGTEKNVWQLRRQGAASS